MRSANASVDPWEKLMERECEGVSAGVVVKLMVAEGLVGEGGWKRVIVAVAIV